MSDTGNIELEERLAALEQGRVGGQSSAPRRSPLLALVVVLMIGAGGALFYLLSLPEEEEALPTATPDVFQNEGDGFGAIETLPPPEPEVVLVAPESSLSIRKGVLLAETFESRFFEFFSRISPQRTLGRGAFR